MGKIFVFCPIKLKFCSWLYKKRWHTYWKFQLEKTSNKKVIAKKLLTNLYEMNSSEYFQTLTYLFLSQLLCCDFLYHPFETILTISLNLRFKYRKKLELYVLLSVVPYYFCICNS